MHGRPGWRGLAGLAIALLTVATMAGCVGAPGSPSAAAGSPVPTPSLVPGSLAAPTADATSSPPAEATDAADEPFTPPDPLCPAPPVAVEAPRLLASVGSASVLMTAGSSGVVTCSTSSSTDVIPVDPTDPLDVAAADVIHLALPAGWHFLYWEGWDRPVGEEGANVTPGGRTPLRPASIDIPAPTRTGRSIVGVSAWVITADGRVLSGIEASVLIER